MLSIAVIEDDDDLRATLVEALEGIGHHALGFDSAEALTDQTDAALDAVLVDINLPGEDGLSLVRRLREVQPETGIIMITGRNDPRDRLLGYSGGADMYLSKPVSTEELGAAVAALERRLGGAQAPGATLQLDQRSCILSGPAGPIRLTEQEVALLAALARAPDRRLEKWQILEIFERTGRAYSRVNVSVTISRLGAKLAGAGAGTRSLRAVRNWGYRLDPVIVLTPDALPPQL